MIGAAFQLEAWSILKFNYEGGRQPGIDAWQELRTFGSWTQCGSFVHSERKSKVYTIAFSLVVCIGNLLMAEMASRVADTIGFDAWMCNVAVLQVTSRAMSPHDASVLAC